MMKEKLYYTGSLSLIVLVGILLGSLSFENAAAASKVTLCHKPGPNQVIIDVNASAVDAHVAHGDIVGGLRATRLLEPAEAAVMDNGRLDFSDPIIWDFDWDSCGEATLYHLYVQRSGAIYPLIDVYVTESSYRFMSMGYISNYNLFDWEWKVQAFVDGEWGPWSEVRTFDVEPLNTD